MTNLATVQRALEIALNWADENDDRFVFSDALAALPLIRADVLERAARAFEPDEDGHDSHVHRWTTAEIAAALRAMKE